MSVDILAFGPHPDDAEIGSGGLLLKLKALGYRTGIAHLTRGEMASRGDAETRCEEAKAAAEILQLDHMQILDFQDCQVTDTYESRLTIARVVRHQRPRIVLAPYWAGVPGRGLGHTDHLTTGLLVSHAVNFARLSKMPIPEPPHTVDYLFYYFLPPDIPPTFVVDISDHAEAYLEAIKCYRSQFHNPNTGAFEAQFFSIFTSMARDHGRSIRAEWGHAFFSPSPLPVRDPFFLTPKTRSATNSAMHARP